MKNKNILIIAVLLLSIFSCKKETEKFKPLSVEEEKIVGRWYFEDIISDKEETAEMQKEIECSKKINTGSFEQFNANRTGFSKTNVTPDIEFKWKYEYNLYSIQTTNLIVKISTEMRINAKGELIQQANSVYKCSGISGLSLTELAYPKGKITMIYKKAN